MAAGTRDGARASTPGQGDIAPEVAEGGAAVVSAGTTQAKKDRAAPTKQPTAAADPVKEVGQDETLSELAHRLATAGALDGEPGSAARNVLLLLINQLQGGLLGKWLQGRKRISYYRYFPARTPPHHMCFEMLFDSIILIRRFFPPT